MPSLVVAVLTFRRNDELRGLLPVLLEQAAALGPDAGVLIVDNDPAGGARELVEGWGSPILRYAHESTPGIAAGRNRALDEATEDLLVFVDDDEMPQPGWLAALVAAFEHYRPAAVVGPVVRTYEGQTHPWIEAGIFRERARHPTGTALPIGATNNLLLDLRVIRRLGLRFDADFGLTGGSDTLFTKQLTSAGEKLVWADDALVLDPVIAERASRRWVMQRTFRLGNTWARVHVLTAPGRGRLLTRVKLVLLGLARIAAGVGQGVAGVATGSMVRRASGVRLVMRGAGITAGAAGYRYVEYRRRAAAGS